MLVSFLAVGAQSAVQLDVHFPPRLGAPRTRFLDRLRRDLQFPVAVRVDAAGASAASSRAACSAMLGKVAVAGAALAAVCAASSHWLLADWATQAFWSKTVALFGTVIGWEHSFLPAAAPCSRSRSSMSRSPRSNGGSGALSLSPASPLQNFAETIAFDRALTPMLVIDNYKGTRDVQNHRRSYYCALRQPLRPAQARPETFVIQAGQSGREATIKIPVGAVSTFSANAAEALDGMRSRKSRRCGLSGNVRINVIGAEPTDPNQARQRRARTDGG